MSLVAPAEPNVYSTHEAIIPKLQRSEICQMPLLPELREREPAKL